MDKMQIIGGETLKGEVSTGGAKNSALVLVFAALLAPGKHRLTNIPRLRDIDSAKLLLESLGCTVTSQERELVIDVPESLEIRADYDIVRKMRASILCLGPLLARMKTAEVSLPGGCAIGARPVDLHLQAMRELGATIHVENGYIHAKTEKLVGSHVLFDFPTVGGTENVLMAAALSEGETLIENAAKEPEIEDLANYLNAMGANIQGAGTSKIEVQGVSQLKPVDHKVIPDRIEAGTLMIASAITGGEVLVKDCDPSHLMTFIEKLKQCGVSLEIGETSVLVRSSGELKPVNIKTGPHPGYPTDLQAQMMVLLTQVEGTSMIEETIFENRFMHVQELLRMNASIIVNRNTAVITGTPGRLMGAQVMATDLRASASLVLAGLAAEGETLVSRIYHLDRGYEGLEYKLSQLGAKISRVKA